MGNDFRRHLCEILISECTGIDIVSSLRASTILDKKKIKNSNPDTKNGGFPFQFTLK